MVYIELGHKYYVHADVDGVWGSGTIDTQEMFLISKNSLDNDLGMATNCKKIQVGDFYFTGHYTDNFQLRFDVNLNGATHSFWNVFITEYTESQYDVGANITLPAEPIRDGYTFAGWYTERVGGTQVTASTKVNYSTTYYAHWTEA